MDIWGDTIKQGIRRELEKNEQSRKEAVEAEYRLSFFFPTIRLVWVLIVQVEKHQQLALACITRAFHFWEERNKHFQGHTKTPKCNTQTLANHAASIYE